MSTPSRIQQLSNPFKSTASTANNSQFPNIFQYNDRKVDTLSDTSSRSQTHRSATNEDSIHMMGSFRIDERNRVALEDIDDFDISQEDLSGIDNLGKLTLDRQ